MSRTLLLVVGLTLAFTLPTTITATHSGDFDATFSPKAGNEWWVEVDVAANHGLSGVDARVDGGSWHGLQLKSWGAWAASFHVPDGSTVEFRATSTGGDRDLSQGYIWPSATPAGDSGDGGTFDADFTPKAGNEWWVEVVVSGNEPIKSVHARADGGSWHALTLRSWGAWAGSFHVPDGSTVTFRATSTDGDRDLSQGYIWPSATPAGDGSGDDTGDGGTAAFDAAFDPKAGNEWWVEVFVSGNEPIKGVHARVDGGSWHALSLRSWGAWAGSFHVPDGSTVVFRATSSDGDRDLSQGYIWPSATPAGDDGNGGDPVGGADIAFGPKAGNEWWVETLVVGDSESLSKVEARVGGGSWHTLTYRDWGAWAGSFHVPDGSTVTFRGTTGSGGVDTSDGFLWPDADPVGSDGSWPEEGSYARYDFTDSPAPGIYEQRYYDYIYHGGAWWWHYTGHFDDGYERKAVEDWGRGNAMFGPTDVQPGDQASVANHDLTVIDQRTEETHQDGDPVTVETWYGEHFSDCRCNPEYAEWDQATGLVVGRHNGGTSWNDHLLLDTDAPMAVV